MRYAAVTALSGMLASLIIWGPSSAVASTADPTDLGAYDNPGGTSRWIAPRTGLYRFELIGGGGGGGDRSSWDTLNGGDSGWQAGGGGGGGAYAAGTLSLTKGQVVDITSGTGGPPGSAWKDIDGYNGADSLVTVGGTVMMRASGGTGGAGYLDGTGGPGGVATFHASVLDPVGYAGGEGGDALILEGSDGYIQGGEGGSAANSSGPGLSGTTQRCTWTAAAVPGSMPSGAGGIGYYGGYDGHGSCGTGNPADFDAVNWTYYGSAAWAGPEPVRTIDGHSVGGGGGGGHDNSGGGSGAGGLVRVTPLTGVPPLTITTSRSAAGSVLVTWSAVTDASAYVATITPGLRTCRTAATSCTITGLTDGERYALQMISVDGTVESEPSDPVSFVLGTPPGQVGAITIGAAPRGARVSWSAGSAGTSPITSTHVISTPDSLTCTATAPARTCDIVGIRENIAYTFTVTATSDSGAGTSRVSASWTFTWPHRPAALAADEARQTSTAAYVSWDAPVAGLTVDSYLLSVSRDGGTMWTESTVTPDDIDGVRVPGLTSSAQAALVRVASVSAGRLSNWADPIIVTTSGKKPVTYRVIDADGRPVVGGAMAWGTSYYEESDQLYGLLYDGTFALPALPAGEVDFVLEDAVTVDGTHVWATWTGVLGYTETVLRLPRTQPSARTIRVQLPNGRPVAGVGVSVVTAGSAAEPHRDTDCLVWREGTLDENDECREYAGFSSVGDVAFSLNVVTGIAEFIVDEAPAPTTGPDGTVTLRGFFNGHVPVKISYRDATGTLRNDVRYIRNTETIITLDAMPYVEMPDKETEREVNRNAAVDVSMTVVPADAELLSRSAVTSLARAKKTITLVPPADAPRAPKSCVPRLTGSPNAQGKLSLRVCATKSGVYTLRTSGIAATESVLIKVRDTAPMPVRLPVTQSRARGSATIAWSAPLYDGASAITGYTVTLLERNRKGAKPVTTTVTGSQRSVTVSKLKNAKSYKVTITARNKFGTSDPVTTTVPVA